MRHASFLRKPLPVPFPARPLALFLVVSATLSCSRAAPPPSPDKAAPASRGPTTAYDSPAKSAPIEMPRTVMRSMEKKEAPPRPVSDRADLLIPGGGETPRLPRDYAIGALGAGSARAEPYRFALETLSLIASGKSALDRFTRSGARESSAELKKAAAVGENPSIRLGSPADEGEGGVSYLVRFVGKDSSAGGEIHLVPGKEGSWQIDSLLLDAETSGAGTEREPSDFDPLIYKRFL